jgi:hypothetical protein
MHRLGSFPRSSTRRRLLTLCLASLLAYGSAATAQTRCGGTERWPVKVGSDSGASLVNTTPETTTLFDLVRLATPKLPPQHEQ